MSARSITARRKEGNSDRWSTVDAGNAIKELSSIPLPSPEGQRKIERGKKKKRWERVCIRVRYLRRRRRNEEAVRCTRRWLHICTYIKSNETLSSDDDIDDHDVLDTLRLGYDTGARVSPKNSRTSGKPRDLERGVSKSRRVVVQPITRPYRLFHLSRSYFELSAPSICTIARKCMRKKLYCKNCQDCNV